MNIQPSLIIWTIICFGLFMLVLDRLLFRPLLKFMDERRRRIEKAHSEYEEYVDSAKKERERLALERAREKQLFEEQEHSRIDDLKKENERKLKLLSADLEGRKLSAVEADGLMSEVMEQVAARLDEMTAAYSNKLIKNGEKR